jgi:predicted nuclease of predicted toxin-antitoxin system
MSDLWVFGDSFSFTNKTDTDIWQFLLAEKLNVAGLHNYSAYGAANDWIYNSFKTHISNIKDEDYIIIQTTDPARKWFIEDQPTVGNLATLLSLTNEELSEMQISKNIKKSIEMYMTHLYSDRLANIEFSQLNESLMFLKNIHNLNNLRIINSIYSISGTLGTLLDVSTNEFVNIDEMKCWYKHYGVDPRKNHLSKENHKVLADKLFTFLTSNSLLDLTTGFKQNFLKVEE